MTRPTLTAAISHARRNVSAVEPHGHRQYIVNVYDRAQRAWHQGHPLPYSAAIGRRREALVTQALLFLGYDANEADFAGAESHADVGGWESVVSRYVRKHPQD